MTQSPIKSARDEAELKKSAGHLFMILWKDLCGRRGFGFEDIEFVDPEVFQEIANAQHQPIMNELEAAERRGVIRGLRMAAQAIDNGDGIPDDYYQKRAVYDAYPNSATHPGNAFDFTSKFLADEADRLEKELNGNKI